MKRYKNQILHDCDSERKRKNNMKGELHQLYSREKIFSTG